MGNLAGTTPDERNLCRQMVMDMNDLFGEAVSGKLASDDERFKKWCKYLGDRLSQTKFLVGDTATVADYHGVFAMAWLLKKDESAKTKMQSEEFPGGAPVWSWWESVQECDAVKKMMTSGVPLIP